MMHVLAQASPDYWARLLEFFRFEYAFAMNALVAAVVVGGVCGVIGTFLVLRGLSLIGDATGHATLPGVCVGFLVARGAKIMSLLLLGALVSGFLAAVLVGVLSRGTRTRTDASIGVVLSVFFGVGIVLLSYIQASPTGAQAGLNSFLYGNAAGVDGQQLVYLASLGFIVIALVAVFWRWLVAVVFDEDFAQSIGIPVRAVHYALLAGLSVAVVVSIQAVGVVLVSAMLIIPPSTALFLSKRIERVVLLSTAFGVFSGAVGAVFSYVFEGVSTGPAMVLVAGALFGVALIFGPRGGILVEHLRRRRRTTEVAHA